MDRVFSRNKSLYISYLIILFFLLVFASTYLQSFVHLCIHPFSRINSIFGFGVVPVSKTGNDQNRKPHTELNAVKVEFYLDVIKQFSEIYA